MTVNTQQRALVVVTSLVTNGRTDLKWLYQWIENCGVGVARVTLRGSYGTRRELTGKAATKAAFLRTLKQLGTRPSIRAIDVILNLHGGRDTLYFTDGACPTPELAKELAALKLSKKLRLLYSTACYGYTHADDFVSGGFKVATGAIGTNANAAVEYPVVLGLWATGATFTTALKTGNEPISRGLADGAAKLNGFPDANSEKKIRGNGRLTIKTVA